MKKRLLCCFLFSTLTHATPVNINTADAATIAASLKGVSVKKSEAIVASRIANGEFRNLDDMHRVSGMGDKTIELNKSDILFTDATKKATERPAPEKIIAASEKSESASVWIIITICIALVAIGLGFWLYRQFKHQKRL